jgi:acylglycerol lipase
LRHFDITRQAPLYSQGWEPKDSPTAVVCLVHGLGEHSGRYSQVAAALTEAGYALLGGDLRGHGKSGGVRGHIPSVDAAMDDIGRLLEEADARYRDRPRFLYGHSLGGNLVLNYALRRSAPNPVSASPARGKGTGSSTEPAPPGLAGVIATGPSLRVAQPISGAKLAAGKVMYRLWPAFRMANGLDRTGLSRDVKVVRAYDDDPLVHDRVSARLGLDLFLTGEYALEHAAEFPVPLLLMHGTADRLTSAAASQEFALRADGHCTLKLWNGLYHEVHNEPERDEVLRFMIAWLESQVCSMGAGMRR